MRSKQDREESEAHRQRMLRQFDLNYSLLPQEKVFELGQEQGLERGYVKGRKEGEIKRIHLAQRVLKLPLFPHADLLLLALHTLTELGDLLEKQIPSE